MISLSIKVMSLCIKMMSLCIKYDVIEYKG